MDFDANQYIDLFFQDTEEHLEILNDALLELEKDPKNKEAISELFRVAHTLKSSSAMVGFEHISNYTHKLEDQLSKIRDGEVIATEEVVDQLFKCFDVLRQMLSNLQDNETEARKNKTKIDGREALSKLQALVEGEPEEEASSGSEVTAHQVVLTDKDRVRIQDHRMAGDNIYELQVILEPETRMAGVRAYLVCNNLRQIGDIIRVFPDILEDESAEVGREFTVILATKESEEVIHKQSNVDEIEKVVMKDVTDVEQYDVIETQPAEKPEQGTETSVDESQEEVPEPTSFERREDRSVSRTVRVDIEKLDLLLNLAGELVINRGRALDQVGRLSSRIGRVGEAEELEENLQEQGRLVNQLQEAIMSTRMVPIGQVFSRFRRVVRDLSKDRKKKVELIVSGEETELDKKIIDQIGDPLTHMVRNSIDHGIESPEDRIAAGKPEVGKLSFNAFHEGNNIHVEVRDDGKGIDVEKVKAKAIEKGLVTADALEQMNERDILQLIFQPGFSTAKEVTDVSGRGVGMDVVKRSIDDLGGQVEIDTKQGEGTRFTIKLPLTLAIIQALLVDVGEEVFALPIANVKETLRLADREIFSVEGHAEVIHLRDSVVPILRLNEVLDTTRKQSNGRIYVAVVAYDDKQVGLVVDRMVNEQEIVIKALEGDVKKVDCIAGASIMGDGSVSLILDIASLVDLGLKTDKSVRVKV